MSVLQAGRPPHVIRIDADGDPDTGFGQGGTAAVAMPPGRNRTLNSLVVDRQGGILLTGSFLLPKRRDGWGRSGRGDARRPSRGFLALTRLLPSGRPDLAFGKGGRIMTGFPSLTEVFAQGATLDSQGRLVLAAAASAPWLPTGGFVLTRYLLGAGSGQ
jgi:hypothetical protein